MIAVVADTGAVRPPENRLHGHCQYVTPAEFEAAFYAAQQPTPTGVGNQ